MIVAAKDLSGAALDWAVAKAEGLPLKKDPMGFGSGSEAGWWVWYGTPASEKVGSQISPSRNWEQGGVILERENIAVELMTAPGQLPKVWMSHSPSHLCFISYGPTALIAAMRTHVAAKLGGDIDIPEDLT